MERGFGQTSRRNGDGTLYSKRRAVQQGATTMHASLGLLATRRFISQTGRAVGLDSVSGASCLRVEMRILHGFDPGHLDSSRGETEIFDIRSTIPRSFCVGTIPAPQNADRSDGW